MVSPISEDYWSYFLWFANQIEHGWFISTHRYRRNSMLSFTFAYQFFLQHLIEVCSSGSSDPGSYLCNGDVRFFVSHIYSRQLRSSSNLLQLKTKHVQTDCCSSRCTLRCYHSGAPSYRCLHWSSWVTRRSDGGVLNHVRGWICGLDTEHHSQSSESHWCADTNRRWCELQDRLCRWACQQHQR